MAIREKAITDVEVNGKSATEVLNDLAKSAEGYKKQLVEALKAGDKLAESKARKSLKETENAMKSVEKATFDVNKVMNNLSKSTLSDLQRAQRQLQAELKKTSRGTEEWTRKTNDLSKVNTEIRKVKREMNGVAGSQQSMWSKMGASFSKLAGYAAAAWGVVKGGEAIIKSAQGASDQWEVALMGVKWGLDSVMKSIATMDFSNFLQNIRDSIKEGREYAKVLDDLGDRTRAYKINESELRIEIEMLERVRDNVLLSNKERYDAAVKINELETKILAESTDLKKKSFENDVRLVKNSTKLSGERVKQFVKEYSENEKLREQAEAYNGAMAALSQSVGGTSKAFKFLTGDFVSFATKTGLTKEQLENLREIIQNTPEDVVEYANTLKAVNATNDVELDKMVQSWVELNTAELTFYRNTERNQKKLNELLKSLRNEEYKDALEILDKEFKQKELALNNDYLNSKITKEELSSELEVLELAHLEALLAMQRKYGIDTIDTEMKLTEKRIAIMERLRDRSLKFNEEVSKANQAFMTKFFEDNQLSEEKFFNESLKRAEDFLNAEFGLETENQKNKDLLAQEALARRIQELNEYKAISDQLASSMGAAIGQFMTDTEMSQEEFGRSMVMMFLDVTHSIVRMAIAQIWAKAMPSGDSIATFGVAGIAKAMALSAIVEAVFAGVKSAVSQRAAGKYDVIGAEDGRTYKNVPYRGKMKTGVYSTPTLVAEHGSELVVDAGTLRNIQVNFPDVLPKVRAAMVPQMAAGNVSTAIPQSGLYSDEEVRSVLKLQTSILNRLDKRLSKDLVAKMSYEHFKSQYEKAQKIERDTSRSN